MKTRRMKMLFTWVAFALVARSPAFSQRLQHSAEAENAVVCRFITAIPVALGPGQPINYTVGGELCATQEELSTGTPLQLLIHGAAYNHNYWNFGTVDGSNTRIPETSPLTVSRHLRSI
jgi:hypothetical protein